LGGTKLETRGAGCFVHHDAAHEREPATAPESSLPRRRRTEEYNIPNTAIPYSILRGEDARGVRDCDGARCLVDQYSRLSM
jgi:hypothetical protein